MENYLILIKNADVYSPEPMGVKDLLIAAGKIVQIGDAIELPEAIRHEVIDLKGEKLVPGFIDNHVHITGGGGEGGFTTRTPEVMLSTIISAGVTTVIGTLGTDGTTRTMANLVAKAHALDEEGITCYFQIGSYEMPLRTVTGSVIDDMVYMDRAIGVGEVAVSDHRSTVPQFEEFARLVAQARLGGMVSGKAGTVNVHMGDSPRTTDLLLRVIEETDIPIKHLIPTHMNRNPYIYEKSKDLAKLGCFVDFTTSIMPKGVDDGTVLCAKALKEFYDMGLLDKVTFSSDGGGSMPIFDSEMKTIGVGVGTLESLYTEVRNAVLDENIPLEEALKVITTNPAEAYVLKTKGKIGEGMDADLVIIDSDLNINTVIAKGKIVVKNGEILVKGTFE